MVPGLLAGNAGGSMSGGVVTASLLPERGVRRRHEEADTQAAVMAFLAWALPADAIAHHSPGEGKRTKGAQVALRRSGHRAGWPDIEIIWRGRALFVELKSASGRISPAQRDTHKRLIYAGAEVCVCRTREQVEAALLEIGVPLRGRLS
jgi:hypothetical protein